MSGMQRWGGYAAVITGVLFLAILVIQFAVLAPLGYTGPSTPPEKVLALVRANSTTPFLILDLISVGFSITLVLGALALRERLRAGAPNRMRIAVIAASIGSALFLANGITSFDGFPPIVEANDPAAFAVLTTVTTGLATAGIFAYGWTAVLWGWAGLATKGLPTFLSYILLLAGAVAILAFLVPILGLVGLVINAVWAFWLGYVLLTKPMMTAS